MESNFLELSSDVSSIFANVFFNVVCLVSTFVRRSACSVSGLATADELTAAASLPTYEERPPILQSRFHLQPFLLLAPIYLRFGRYRPLGKAQSYLQGGASDAMPEQGRPAR
jgi:hypothetical protein